MGSFRCFAFVGFAGTINRFAAAFLVPCERARYKLGEKRHNLSPDELFLLKHKYGSQLAKESRIECV